MEAFLTAYLFQKRRASSDRKKEKVLLARTEKRKEEKSEGVFCGCGVAGRRALGHHGYFCAHPFRRGLFLYGDCSGTDLGYSDFVGRLSADRESEETEGALKGFVVFFWRWNIQYFVFQLLLFYHHSAYLSFGGLYFTIYGPGFCNGSVPLFVSGNDYVAKAYGFGVGVCRVCNGYRLRGRDFSELAGGSAGTRVWIWLCAVQYFWPVCIGQRI